MRDEVIRIILEAKDRLSNTVRNAERNINQSFGNIRNDLKRTDKDFNKFQDDVASSLTKSDSAMRRWSNSIRGHFRGVQNEMDKTTAKFHNLRDSSGRFATVSQSRRDAISQSPVGRAVGAFKEGRTQAAELERQLREQIATTKENLEEQKKKLEERIHLERESVIEEGNIKREQLRREIVNSNKNLDAQILKLNQAEAARQAKRDEQLDKRIRRRNIAFENLRKKAEDALRDEIYERRQAFYDEQFNRKQTLRDDIAEVKRSGQLSKLEQDKRIDALRKAEADINRKEQRRRDEDIRKLELADDKIKRGDATQRDIDIAEEQASAAKIRREKSQSVDDEIRKLKAGNSEINKEKEVALATELRQRRQAAETEFRTARQALRTGANEADIVKNFLEKRAEVQALDKDTNRLSRTFRKAGNDFGDFMRGLRRGRSDLRGVDNIARRVDTAFARFGQTIGKFTRNIGQLVNLRWYLLISFVQILGQLVTVLAANLISLASSAALAASALGAGLLAAVSQVIPVVGLLAAAFSRVGAAFTAAQQANKANAQSSQDSRAQAEAQTAAQQGLTDALYNQKQAVQALADARKQAQRDIVDAIFAERDANYALKDAEFAVLDAKQRLRDLENQSQQDQQAVRDAEAALREAKARLAAAKAEGDQAEIEQANVNLAIAQQNLADAKGQAAESDSNQRQIKEQRLAVSEAELRLQEARVAAKRQREDTKAVVAAGVEGSKTVVDALHGVAIANREVADAQRGVTDASKKQASAGNLLQRQLSQLDPAERGLYRAFRRIYKQFKDTFRPITDIIVNAVTRAVNRVGPVLENPKFIGAFRRLAKAIARGIDELSKFFTSDGFISDFTEFIDQATKNIPILIRILENLVTAFLGIAKAGQPVFRDLLGGFEKLTGRFAKSVNAPALSQDQEPGGGRFAGGAQQTQAQKFISGAQTYLDSWLKLAGAIGRVFKYLFLDAAPAGDNLVGALTRTLNNLADFLRDNPQKVDNFFKRMYRNLVSISSVLFPLVKVLLEAFTGDQATAFTKFTVEVVLPGIAILLKFLGVLAQVGLALSHVPGVKLFLQLLVAEKAINRIFPATQRVTDALKRMGGWFFRAGEDGSRGFTKIRRASAFLAQRVKREVKFVADQFVLIGRGAKKAADVVYQASRRIIAAMVTATKAVARFVWEMTVAAVKAMRNFAKAVIADALASLRTFAAFIGATVIPRLYALGAAMFAALGPWGLIALAVIALIAGIVLLLRHFHLLTPVLNFFKSLVVGIFDWIKDHWKLLAAILTGPFGLAIYAIIKFKDKIYDFFKSIINWVREHWKGLAQILIAIFLPGGVIIAAIWKWHDKIVDIAKSIKNKVVGFFKELWRDIKHIFSDVAHFLTSHLTPHVHLHWFGPIPYPSITFGDEKDEAKDQKEPKKRKSSGSPARDLIPSGVNPRTGIPYTKGTYDRGGVIPGKHGVAVPIIAHAGEWVLNKMQQMKAASHLNMPLQNLKNFLFGDPLQRKKRKQRQDAADMHHHRGDIHGSGGKVRGFAGEPVKIIAHAGEWILDKSQQIKLAHRFHEAIGRVATFLFGEPKTKKKEKKTTHAGVTPTHHATTTHKKKRERKGGKFFPYNLVGETDDNGNIVYFVEDTEEQFLELAKIDALHMLRSNGKYIPKWIEKYGYHLKRFKNAAEKAKGYAAGGIIGTNAPSFAMGGVVNSPQNDYATSAISNVNGDTQHKKVEQNFKVHTQGETDWNYVMRLAAMHAQEAF